MNKDALPPKGEVNVNLMEAVPRDAEVVEHRRDHLICETEETVVEKEKVRDADGNVVKKESPDGGYQYPAYETEERTEMVRFALEARSDGRVVKNYDFEASEEEIRRREAAARRDQMLDALEEQMAETGESPKEIARRLVQGDVEAVETAENGSDPEAEADPPPSPSESGSEPRPAPTVEAGGYEARMTRPGVWESEAFESPVEGNAEQARSALRDAASQPAG